MNNFPLQDLTIVFESNLLSLLRTMHYLSYLAVKLATELRNHSTLLNPGADANQGNGQMIADSLRLVLEEEVVAGRLRYNALACDMKAVAAQEKSAGCFPGWNETES